MLERAGPMCEVVGIRSLLACVDDDDDDYGEIVLASLLKPSPTLYLPLALAFSLPPSCSSALSEWQLVSDRAARPDLCLLCLSHAHQSDEE